MSIFSKLLEPLSKTINKELEKHANKNASKEAGKNLAKSSNNPHEQKQIHKEQRGIYNVTYNGKFSTPIKKDLDTLDEALRYAQGNKNKGAKHIRVGHTLDEKQEGYISAQELLNLGKNIREYLAKHKEPFIDKDGSRIYEWRENGVNFRVVSSDSASGRGANSPITSTTSTEDIITFYSDRNLANGKVFEFKNPKLQESIQNLPFTRE